MSTLYLLGVSNIIKLLFSTYRVFKEKYKLVWLVGGIFLNQEFRSLTKGLKNT